jgi:hypothetical protein
MLSLLFLKHRAGPLIAASLLCAGLAALLSGVDAFSPAELPQGFSSQRQLVGIVLLLILLPPYLVFAWGGLERRSWRLLGQVDQLLEVPEYQSRLAAPRILLLTGAALGIVYAVVFNLPVTSLQELLAGGPLLVVLVACMILVWLTVGVALVARIRVAGLFLDAGRKVPIDLYDQTALEPFGRAGMGDMLMVAGALVLSTVQSIDAMFRYQNYLFALAVAVPAALFLLMRPMLSVHARLKARKASELNAVNALIRPAPKDLRPDAILSLEARPRA